MRINTFTRFLAAAAAALCVSGTFAQTVVTGSRGHTSLIPAGTAVWIYESGTRVFASLDAADIPSEFTVLDENGHTGRYYWVTGGTPAGGRIIWQGQEGVLVKFAAAPSAGIQAGMDRIQLDCVTFPPGRTGQPKRTAAAPAHTDDVSALLDSVRLSELIRTEEHLTGEESFTLGSVSYNLQTRYVYSPQIGVARLYLVSELNRYGYNAYLQEFQLGAGKAVSIEPSFPQPGIACSGSVLLSGMKDGPWHALWQDDKGRILTALSRPDAGTVWAVGHGGMILKYDLAGSGPTLRSETTGADLFDIFFTEETHGFICGSGGLLLATENGGADWTAQNTGTDADLHSVRFIDSRSGWAAGEDGILLTTADGGHTWTRQETGTGARLRDICFVDPHEGWIAGSQSTLLHSTDGGRSWRSVSLPVSASLLDIDFTDRNTGYLAGRGGTLLRTRDGGESWQACPGAIAGDIHAVAAVDDNTVVTGSSLGLRISGDAGRSFRAAAAAGLSFYNIIAEKTGTLYPDITYIIGAHFDSINNSGDPMIKAPGADDNGSGTAAVLEAARVLAPYSSDYTIKFILFTAEEIGLYGSKAYAGRAVAEGENIAGVINLDMIGYDGDDDGHMELHTNFQQTGMVDSMIQWAADWFLAVTPSPELARNNSDHAPFLNAGYQALMMIEDTGSDFNPQYHSADDLLAYMQLDYFRSNVQLAVGTLARFAGIDVTSTAVEDHDIQPAGFTLHAPWPNPFNPEVTTAVELAAGEAVTLEVFDLLGRPVKRLYRGFLASGYHEFSWSGTDRTGNDAASGIYFITCRTAGGTIEKRKIVLMR